MPFKEDFYQVSHLVNCICSKDLLIPAKYNTKNHQENQTKHYLLQKKSADNLFGDLEFS